MLLANSQEIREADRIQIDTHKYPGIVLMEEAGRQCTEFLLQNYESHRPFLLLAGPGNNGGDVLVIARHLHLKGREFRLLLSHDPNRYKGDAGINFRMLAEMPISYEIWEGEEGTAAILKSLRNPVLIDGLLGTGIDSVLRGRIQEMIAFFSQQELETVAIDLPSGLDANTGFVLNKAIPATHTLTFQLPKICQYVYPAANYCGKTHVFDIGLWPEVIQKLGIERELLDNEFLARRYTAGEVEAHKGSMGHVLLIGGSKAYAGAIAMSAFAALKAGAGLVSILAPKSCRHVCQSLAPELMFLEGSHENYLQEKDLDLAEKWLEGKNALVIGPGMGQDSETTQFLTGLLPKIGIPSLWDADALNILAAQPELLTQLREDAVLSPHPGEMARLIKQIELPGDWDIKTHRLEIAEAFVKIHPINLILKGAGSIVATNSGTSYINSTGNPGMATAGSGDILSGIVGALLGKGYEAGLAAALGVFVHGRAGDKAAEQLGQEAILATDIARHLNFDFS